MTNRVTQHDQIAECWKEAAAPEAPRRLAKAERRSEPRVPATDRIRLYAAVAAGVIEGKLLDTSAHGFRAIHSCAALGSGQLVSFERPDGSGQARVAWTRIEGTRVESGFYVLS